MEDKDKEENKSSQFDSSSWAFKEPFPNVWPYFAQKVLENPEKIAESQLAYYQQYIKICQNFSAHLAEDVVEKTTQVFNYEDKRFKHPDWQNNIMFDFIKQSYLLTAEHVKSFVKEIVGEDDPQFATKVNFYTDQLMDALSPTNFVNTNPEVLRTILETGGKNLLQGFQHFLNDLENSHGIPTIKMTDMDYFEIGKNIAITPGKVVYQNEVMQLIQYAPTTAKVHQNPLLIVPPWIKKYYILDLQAENSFVKWLVEQGHTVFMISWINPLNQQGNKDFSEYMFEGPIAALNVIEKIVGQSSVNMMGYCVGGTLLGAALAYLSAKNDTRISSVTFLTTLLDFSEPGVLGVFIDEDQINAVEKQMQKKGYLDGSIIAAAFNSLRANELIWNYFVHNYLKGKKPLPFDLLYWNSDDTNLPEKLHGYCLREMYLHNRLAKRNELKISEVSLDLKKITIPSFFLATKEDHIVLWTGSYKSMKHLSGPRKFVLASSGHVAGVVNHPVKNKYGYWCNDKKPKDAEAWLKEAKYYEGSWWNCWEKWIKKYHGDLVSARYLSDNSIEDAPGSYVKVRLGESELHSL